MKQSVNLETIQMNKLTFLVGSEEVLKEMKTVRCLPIFSQQVVSFLGDLSKELRRDSRSSYYADILSYAFWIRNASIEKEKEKHLFLYNRIGRGVTFHIAPSNVPINFAVSMTSALLAGNACVIRVSNKNFEQVDIVCDAINRLLAKDYKTLKNYFCIVRYEHDEDVTQMLSSLCDVRVIWGGNQTIQLIRRASLPPRSIELAFADRYSIALIDSDYYLEQDGKKVAKEFYTDTYYSDQNACSSPRLVVWFGKSIDEAKERFWRNLAELAHQDYELHPIQGIDKLSSLCLASANCTIQDETTVKSVIEDNYLYRLELTSLDTDFMQYKDAGGFFFEYSACKLEELVPVLKKQCQTIAVLGVSEQAVYHLVEEYGVPGVDRIVPVGKTMELSFIWDGYDMIETMSRVVMM